MSRAAAVAQNSANRTQSQTFAAAVLAEIHLCTKSSQLRVRSHPIRGPRRHSEPIETQNDKKQTAIAQDNSGQKQNLPPPPHSIGLPPRPSLYIQPSSLTVQAVPVPPAATADADAVDVPASVAPPRPRRREAVARRSSTQARRPREGRAQQAPWGPLLPPRPPRPAEGARRPLLLIVLVLIAKTIGAGSATGTTGTTVNPMSV